MLAVGRKHRMAGIEGIVRHLNKASAVAVDDEGGVLMARATAIGFKGDARSVRRPGRRSALHRNGLHRPGRAAAVSQPDLVVLLIIKLAMARLAGKGHPFAIR